MPERPSFSWLAFTAEQRSVMYSFFISTLLPRLQEAGTGKQSENHVLQRLLQRSCDDIILNILLQIDEVCRITCHSHQNVAIFLWFLLRGTECLIIHHVELNVLPVLRIKVSTNDCFDDVQSFFHLLRWSGQISG